MKPIGRMTSHGVDDGRTAIRLRSRIHVMGAALGLLLASPTFAAVTAKGSRVCNDSRGVLEDPDVTHQLGNVAVQLIYAAGVDQQGGNWFTTAEDHTLQYREYPDGTFADVPVTRPGTTMTNIHAPRRNFWGLRQRAFRGASESRVARVSRLRHRGHCRITSARNHRPSAAPLTWTPDRSRRAVRPSSTPCDVIRPIDFIGLSFVASRLLIGRKETSIRGQIAQHTTAKGPPPPRPVTTGKPSPSSHLPDVREPCPRPVDRLRRCVALVLSTAWRPCSHGVEVLLAYPVIIRDRRDRPRPT